MSYHHHNRMLAHWQPKRRPEGESLTWGSKERFEKISSSAGFVAVVVANHLNDETNTYEISIKTLIRETERTKGTIGKALTELVEWGILTRTRANKERPYRYSLAITCPPECDHLSIHNTPSELATLPIKQATPMPKEQETSSLKNQAKVSPENRQLIDTHKQLNKKTDREKSSICSSCIGEEYRDKVLHQQECPEYLRLKDWKPWQITQRANLDKWAKWDYREKQIATLDGLRAYDEKQASKGQEELEKFNQMVADQAGERPLLPLWREWLWLRVQMYPTSRISVTDLTLALEHSERGQELEEKAGWRQYPHNQPHSYYRDKALAETF
jgi:hypothetical protein